MSTAYQIIVCDGIVASNRYGSSFDAPTAEFQLFRSGYVAGGSDGLGFVTGWLMRCAFSSA